MRVPAGGFMKNVLLEQIIDERAQMATVKRQRLTADEQNEAKIMYVYDSKYGIYFVLTDLTRSHAPNANVCTVKQI
jgi:hypothetical protein